MAGVFPLQLALLIMGGWCGPNLGMVNVTLVRVRGNTTIPPCKKSYCVVGARRGMDDSSGRRDGVGVGGGS